MFSYLWTFCFCHISPVQQFPVRSSLTYSFLLKNDTHRKKTSHILLRNADKLSIQPDSTIPGKIHYELSQSYANSYCHQTGDAQHYTDSYSHIYQGEAATTEVMDCTQLG